MKSSLFEMLSIISFALAGAFFIGAVFVFFKFKIVSVVGYLTGATAKKKIKQMQDEKYNETSAELKGQKGNTDKLTTRKIKNKNTNNVPNGDLKDNKSSNATEVLGGGESTTVLDGSEQTTVLSNNATTVVYDDGTDSSGTTQTLSQRMMPEEKINIEYNDNVSVYVEQSIIFTGTDDIIK